MKDMLGRGGAVTPEEALTAIFNNLKPDLPPAETVPIDSSYGRVLSADIVSPEDMPAFSRSTMDGYAVRASDTFGATEGMPAYIEVPYDIPMGAEPGFKLDNGQAARIATGGMIPKGADAVLMLENAQAVDERTIECLKPVAPGDNVIERAEDVAEGETVLTKGRRLRPADVAAMAGLGITEVSVYLRPKVSIISTGDEIVPPGEPLKAAHVRDMNSFNLTGLVSMDGGEPVNRGIVKDEYGLIKAVFEVALQNSEMVLISGGSSVGARDMTAKVIGEAGSPGVLFHGVSMKPGKPLIAGIVGSKKPVFGLPGHPAAVTVCYEKFIRPVLRLLSGESITEGSAARRTLRARMARSVSSQAGREEYVRVSLKKAVSPSEEGLKAVPVLGKSGLITTLVRADGTVCIPLGVPGVDEGQEVEVELFD